MREDWGVSAATLVAGCPAYRSAVPFGHKKRRLPTGAAGKREGM